jgi:predicted membrane channel-forming protein YqfA (hemolysin III family)
VAVVFVFPKIPQHEGYHNFADQRTFLGIGNFLNVLSNTFFLIVGWMGIRFVWTTSADVPSPFTDVADRYTYLVFFVSVAATSLGSGYYHLRPDDARLVWDRLPMAVAFMTLLGRHLRANHTPKRADLLVLASNLGHCQRFVLVHHAKNW